MLIGSYILKVKSILTLFVGFIMDIGQINAVYGIS